MCVVPRRILHNESSNEVIAVAMLDTYSQGIFSTDDLMKKLDNQGTKTSINIKALMEMKSNHLITVNEFQYPRCQQQKMKSRNG